MDDWKSIDTSTPEGLHQLNVLIAKRLGWRIEAGDYVWRLIFPNGRQLETVYATERWDESAVWKNIYAHSEHTRPPRFAADLRSAASLPLDDGFYMTVRVYPDGKARASIIAETFEGWESSTLANTEALARCLEWLDWRDAVNDESLISNRFSEHLSDDEWRLIRALRNGNLMRLLRLIGGGE